MSLVKEGLLVYPLRQRRVRLGDRVIFDRATRGKSWFILDLAVPGGKFVPAGSDALCTADGRTFCCASRYKENV